MFSCEDLIGEFEKDSEFKDLLFKDLEGESIATLNLKKLKKMRNIMNLTEGRGFFPEGPWEDLKDLYQKFINWSDTICVSRF